MSANASALVPSAAANPNVRWTRVIIKLLQTFLSFHRMCGAFRRSALRAAGSVPAPLAAMRQIAMHKICANSKATIYVAVLAIKSPFGVQDAQVIAENLRFFVSGLIAEA
ncbi:MAG: hypothetical protein QM681_23010 [Novosphingobium sp.]